MLCAWVKITVEPARMCTCHGCACSRRCMRICTGTTRALLHDQNIGCCSRAVSLDWVSLSATSQRSGHRSLARAYKLPLSAAASRRQSTASQQWKSPSMFEFRGAQELLEHDPMDFEQPWCLRYGNVAMQLHRAPIPISADCFPHAAGSPAAYHQYTHPWSTASR